MSYTTLYRDINDMKDAFYFVATKLNSTSTSVLKTVSEVDNILAVAEFHSRNIKYVYVGLGIMSFFSVFNCLAVLYLLYEKKRKKNNNIFPAIP